MTTKRKRGCLHLPVRLSRPTTALAINRQRNTHVGVYSTPVKCALKVTRTLAAHYGAVYDTPRGVTPAVSLIAISIVVVSIRPKTKRQ